MTKSGKIILGILTFLPLVFGMCCLVYYLLMIKDIMLVMPVNRGDQQAFMRSYMSHIFSGPLMISMVLTVLTHLGLMIYYIVHVVSLRLRSEGEKVMWILLFIFIGTISYIIYFFMKVVPLPAPGTAGNSGDEQGYSG